MPDKFSLEGEGLEPEASLDDFFQPSTEPTRPTATAPVKGAKAAPSDTRLPVDRDKLFPPEASEQPPQLEITDLEPEPEKKGGGLFSNKLLLVLIAVLIVAVVGAGSFFAYTMFFSPKEEVAATTPPPPKPQPAPTQETPAPPPAAEKAEAKTPSAPPGTTPAEGQAAAPSKPEKKKKGEAAPAPAAPAAKPEKPQAAAKGKPAAPAPAPAAAQPEKAPAGAKGKPAPKPPAAGKESAAKQPEVKKAPGPPPAPPPKVALAGRGPYRIQVGAYALAESQVEPVNKLKELGLTDYNFVPRDQKVHLYDVAVGKALDKAKADDLAKKLTDMDFAPRLEPDGAGSKVIAYSYGNRADADRAKAKIERAGLGKASISSSNRTMTLQQLRVGHFPSQSAAQETLSRLRQAGFRPVIVREP
jgi:hypothetical protein